MVRGPDPLDERVKQLETVVEMLHRRLAAIEAELKQKDPCPPGYEPIEGATGMYRRKGEMKNVLTYEEGTKTL
jgi:hypothetical protein